MSFALISIGLTGGYATGKSTVADMLRDLGAVVVNADELSRQAIRRGQKGWRETADRFGEGIVGPDGEIDRALLGARVFADPEQRRLLESIIHPKVIVAVREAKERAAAAGEAVFVCEAPLLFEAGLTEEFDQVWVVAADPDRQLERASARDQLTGEAIGQRMRAQMPLAEKAKLADLVIWNNGDLEDLRHQVREAWRMLPSALTKKDK